MMRRAPAIPCSKTGCYKLQPCPLHPKKPFASVRRPSSSTAQGYGARHRAWRVEVLAKHPNCEYPGCQKASTDAHHIVPIRRGGKRFDVDNGMGLCHEHHSAATGRETRG